MQNLPAKECELERASVSITVLSAKKPNGSTLIFPLTKTAAKPLCVSNNLLLNALVAQLAEAADLKSAKCRFESDWGHHITTRRDPADVGWADGSFTADRDAPPGDT